MTCHRSHRSRRHLRSLPWHAARSGTSLRHTARSRGAGRKSQRLIQKRGQGVWHNKVGLIHKSIGKNLVLKRLLLDTFTEFCRLQDDPDLDEEGQAAFAEASELREQDWPVRAVFQPRSLALLEFLGCCKRFSVSLQVGTFWSE